jgi:hypothetical protein
MDEQDFDQQDFDQRIDRAAAQMVRREPPDALTVAVIDRVNRGHGTPAFHRPVVWGGLTASAAIVILLIGVNLHRMPRAAERPPSAAMQQVAAQPADQPGAAITKNFVFEPSRQPRKSSTPKSPPSAVARPDEQDARVPPITIDPISTPQPIQVPGIEIEPLHIEPLSASND